jgi:arabinan endo-1,5-alpha-L-arabinosidase
MIQRDGWYYLFVSWDTCCKGVDSTYKIMVGRSKDVLGPYVDAEGNRMTDGGGTLVLERQGRWIGPGHNSVLNDNCKYYLVYHTYDGDNRGQSVLQIRPLTWDKNGWPKPGDILDSYDMSPRPNFRRRRPQ